MHAQVKLYKKVRGFPEVYMSKSLSLPEFSTVYLFCIQLHPQGQDYVNDRWSIRMHKWMIHRFLRYICTDAYGIEYEYLIYRHPGSGGRFKNTYELLNLRALKFSYVNKIHIFQCMG